MSRDANQSQGVKMFSIGYVLLVLQSQLNNDDAWRQQGFEWYVGACCVIHSVKPRTVPLTKAGIKDIPELFDWGKFADLAGHDKT